VYDIKNLAKLKIIEASAPEGMKAFWAFDKAAMAAGAIPVKGKELMALAGVHHAVPLLHPDSLGQGPRGGSFRSGNFRSGAGCRGPSRRRCGHARLARDEIAGIV
jgi:hypothetical protein